MSAANPEHVELVRTGNWKQRRWWSHGPLDLMDADLTGIQLGRWPDRIHEQTSHYDVDAFGKARFVRTILSRSYLQCLVFDGVDFTDTDLSQSRIEGCRFSEALFRRTNLRRTVFALRALNVVDPPLDEFQIEPTISLRSAIFDAVQVDGTDFSGVEFDHTTILDTDLSNAISLERSAHRSSSFLSPSTLRLSRGLIPRRFLQGIGLQDWEIESVQLYADGLSTTDRAEVISRALKLAQPRTFYSVFISHSHAEKEFANGLYEELQNAGIRCWLDEHQLLPGDDIYEQVARGISLWDKVLLCCSEASLSSWWVDNEIDAAFAKEQRLMRERGRKVFSLIPLDLDGYLLEGWMSGKAVQVRSRLAADFRNWKHDVTKFKTSVDRLIRALEVGELGREAPPEARI